MPTENDDVRIPQNTPVSQEVLSQLDHIVKFRTQLSIEGIDIDLRKVQILATIRRLDQQRDEIFNKILTERGFAPGTVIEIDPKTGAFEMAEDKPSA